MRSNRANCALSDSGWLGDDSRIGCQESPMPQFQSEEREDFLSIETGFSIGPKHRFNARGVEIATLDGRAIEQHFMNKLLKVGSQPGVEWYREAGFPSLQNWLRNAIRECPLGKILRRKTAYFQILRQ